MLGEIGTVDRIPEYIKRAKDKNDTLPPDGLRPPRLQELRSARQDHAEDRHEVLSETRPPGRSAARRSRWSSSASRCSDEYFIEKKLYPNVDFYSGITLKAMGFPTTHVHRAVRARAHRRLDRAVEGNDRGSEPEDRPSAPALHRRDRGATTCRSRGASRRLPKRNAKGRLWRRPFLFCDGSHSLPVIRRCAPSARLRASSTRYCAPRRMRPGCRAVGGVALRGSARCAEHLRVTDIGLSARRVPPRYCVTPTFCTTGRHAACSSRMNWPVCSGERWRT